MRFLLMLNFFKHVLGYVQSNINTTCTKKIGSTYEHIIIDRETRQKNILKTPQKLF